jgi:hypothetical protein
MQFKTFLAAIYNKYLAKMSVKTTQQVLPGGQWLIWLLRMIMASTM